METIASKPERVSRINKPFLLDVLRNIGIPNKLSSFRKKRTKIAPLMRKGRHHLTNGSSVDVKVVQLIEDSSKNAFRIPEVGQIVQSRRNRRSFHTHRSRLEAQKLERLFVPEEVACSDDSEDERDPEFHRIINGRPPKGQGTIREHTWAVQSCFLSNLKEGELKNQMKVMEDIKIREKELLDKTEIALLKQMDGFNQFLREDHADCAKWLSEAEATAAVTEAQSKIIAELRKELKAKETRVQLLEDDWQQSKILQQFIYQVTPVAWRKNDEDDDNTADLTVSNIQPEEPDLDKDLKSRIESFMREAPDIKTPNLCFENPDQLFSIFQALEDTYLDSLLQCEQLKPSVRTMVSTLAKSKAVFHEERTYFADDVSDLTSLVSTGIESSRDLEETVKKICQQNIYCLLNEFQSVNITACVEDAYERIVGPNDNDLDALAMIKAIETEHENLAVGLDILPNAVVAKIKSGWEKEERRVMEVAHDAAKKVHQMNMLIKKLTNALKPASIVRKRRLVGRSEPPKETIMQMKPPRQLTTEELDQRDFFEEVQTDDMYRPRF